MYRVLAACACALAVLACAWAVVLQHGEVHHPVRNTYWPFTVELSVRDR